MMLYVIYSGIAYGKHFKDMPDKDRVTYLMNVNGNANGENIVKVAKYCFEGFEKRKNAVCNNPSFANKI